MWLKLCVIFRLILVIYFSSPSGLIAVTWIPQDPNVDKAALVHVMILYQALTEPITKGQWIDISFTGFVDFQ